MNNENNWNLRWGFAPIASTQTIAHKIEECVSPLSVTSPQHE